MSNEQHNEHKQLETKEFNTALTNINSTFLPLIERQLSGNGIRMDDYTKQCVLMGISSIHSTLDNKGIKWDDAQLDKSSVTQALLSVAALKLNAAASPREIFFSIRNVKTKDKDGKDCWKKQIEMGIEGDGNDSILARFGRDVKKVCQFWIVREGDDFEYPEYNGIEVKPPKWSPKGKGDVIRVVYPIMKNDGTVEYYIAERNDVARNLLAHINNNLMNETFGICADRYKATDAQKKQISERKSVILKKASELGLLALDDEELQSWISPSYTEYQSRESMLTRKMRNNIVKKIPKDFGNAFVEITYSDNTDDTAISVRHEIEENSHSEIIDIDPSGYSVNSETKAEPEKNTEAEADQQQEKKVGPGF